MHKINVLAFGNKNFNTSLEELKDYLNFKLTTINDSFENKSLAQYEVLLVHEDFLNKNIDNKLLQQTNKIKILVFSSKNNISNIFSEQLSLPTNIKDLNKVVQNSIAKKNFNKNSSIKIKNYILDKNEKKLAKFDDYILLTEKEVQLLELFLISKKSINKSEILDKVWQYSSDADTHTVETHIYRLRKKIKAKFSDENFILNDKNGYLL